VHDQGGIDKDQHDEQDDVREMRRVLKGQLDGNEAE
jgi:hypothetical protein